MHGVANIVEIFDWSLQALVQILDEVEDILHLMLVLEVTVLAVGVAPRLRLDRQAQLQLLCRDRGQ